MIKIKRYLLVSSFYLSAVVCAFLYIMLPVQIAVLMDGLFGLTRFYQDADIALTLILLATVWTYIFFGLRDDAQYYGFNSIQKWVLLILIYSILIVEIVWIIRYLIDCECGLPGLNLAYAQIIDRACLGFCN